jgi:uncharacterized protein (TIGR02118 family)
MVYSLAFLTKPKPGVTLEEFYSHYTNVHRPLAEKLPGLVSYRQSRILKDGYRSGDAIDYAAYSEYVFDSAEDAITGFEGPEGRALNEDTGLFMDWPSVLTIPLAELGTFFP